jgi:hypothetical protein
MAIPAVFAVLPRNYQRAGSRPWRKTWVAGGLASEKTAGRPLFFRCFPLLSAVFLRLMQSRERGATAGNRFTPQLEEIHIFYNVI